MTVARLNEWRINFKPHAAAQTTPANALAHFTTFNSQLSTLHPQLLQLQHHTSPALAKRLLRAWQTTFRLLHYANGRVPFAKEERKLNTTLTFASNQDLLDTLWGYYFATGSHAPVQRIIQMLPWSKSRDTIDKLTVGSMARYTLASYAIRDASLREYLRSELARQPAAVKAPLAEVVEAADTVQIAALRKDALAAVDELKIKGSDSRRDLSFWGQVGVGAVALGCVSAAALGQIAVGIPCVIGGSASQGFLSFWEKQQ